MRQHIATNLSLLALHNLDVGFHALLCKRTGEKIANVSVRVQTPKLVSNQVSISTATLRFYKPTVMNCQQKPSLPSSQTKSFMSWVLRPAASQLKEGLRLYASQ